MAKPDTAKTSKAFTHGDLKGAVCTMQGWREYMEDFNFIKNDEKGESPLLIGVFDGHNGESAARYCTNTMPLQITSNPEFEKALVVATDDDGGANNHKKKTKEDPFALGFLRGTDENNDDALTKIFKQVFLDTDEQLRGKNDGARTPRANEAPKGAQECAGTTALIAVVSPAEIIVANCGDSRAVLSRGGRQLPMSLDHKPTRKDERRRIQAAGGYVDERDPGCARVGVAAAGMTMAMSRSLGDFDFKGAPGLPAAAQAIVCTPDLTRRPRRPGRDRFLALASDGVWDVFSNVELVHALDELVQEGVNDVLALAEAIIDKAFWRGSSDNMTIILIDLRTEEQKQEDCKRENLRLPSQTVAHDEPATAALIDAKTPTPTERKEINASAM